MTQPRIVRLMTAQGGRLYLLILILLTLQVADSFAQEEEDSFEGLMTVDQPLPLEPRPDLGNEVFDERLIGFWEHRNGEGTITLEIPSDQELIISGKHVKLEVYPGLLRVNDGSEHAFDYQYEFKKNQLVLTFGDADGNSHELSFKRINLSLDTIPALNSESGEGQ